MKFLFFSLTTLFLFVQTFAQEKYNAVFFSENGEKFHLLLNNKTLNENPVNNIKITGINRDRLNITVVFSNDKYSNISKQITLNNKNSETAFRIRKNKRNSYFIKKFYTAPINSVQYNRNQKVVSIYDSNTDIVNNGSGNNGNTTTNNNVNNNDININVNVVNTIDNKNGQNKKPKHYHLEGYTGVMGCEWPLKEKEFRNIKRSIKSKGFDSSKLKIAKQILRDNCLLADQVAELVDLMGFESNKLELAKFAYSRTFDQGNYYKVNDVFDFESTIEELQDFINP